PRRAVAPALARLPTSAPAVSAARWESALSRPAPVTAPASLAALRLELPRSTHLVAAYRSSESHAPPLARHLARPTSLQPAPALASAPAVSVAPRASTAFQDRRAGNAALLQRRLHRADAPLAPLTPQPTKLSRLSRPATICPLGGGAELRHGIGALHGVVTRKVGKDFSRDARVRAPTPP
ncbi:MAG: hypothetical protein JWO68_4295, partial [Actinomycetia bacterium]|nr:hypothetical protein [Actinomycetes bacterium]